MFSRCFLLIFISTITINSLVYPTAAKPTSEIIDVKDDITKESYEEVDDLNVLTNADKLQNNAKISASESIDSSHRDEDQLKSATNLAFAQNLKYDVEILESNDVNEKENDEVEERFRGHALKINTDTFYAENIEVSPIDVDAVAIEQGHIILSIILIVVALISVGLYAALVIWRSHLEQRYGMRELLVSHDDDHEYSQQSSGNYTVGQT